MLDILLSVRDVRGECWMDDVVVDFVRRVG